MKRAIAWALVALAFGGPCGAWRWARLLALGLPDVAGVGRLLAVRTADPIRLDPLVALVAFACALAGCHADAAMFAIMNAGTTAH